MQDWEDLVVKKEVVDLEDQEELVVLEERIVMPMDTHTSMAMVYPGFMEYQDSLVVLVHLGQTISQVPMACLLLMVESCGL